MGGGGAVPVVGCVWGGGGREWVEGGGEDRGWEVGREGGRGQERRRRGQLVDVVMVIQ